MTLRHLSLACTVMLAGCPFIKTSTSTSASGPSESGPSATDPSASGSAPGDTTSSNGNDGPNLIGLSVDEATKKIRANGFDGKIEVIDLSEYDKDCKAETVCRVDSPYWYLNQSHFVTLYKNKTISIAVPE